jgi:eukaryotic-like serine/threonine-protein kinase
MSPEQARGDIAKLDVRSDVYSLSVLFHELLGLRHYLEGRDSRELAISGVLKENLPYFQMKQHPNQHIFPNELWHFIRKGMEKDPARRYQSLQEMINALEQIREGDFRIQCFCTFTRRTSVSVMRFADKWPTVNFLLILSSLGGMAFALIWGLLGLLR